MSNDEKILKSAQCKIDKMVYRLKHRFLTGWFRLLYSLRIKWKIYYASHLAQIVIWFFQIRILLLLHSPVSSHANFTVFASKSVPRFLHLKFRYLRTPLQRKYQSAHTQKNLSITTKLHRVFFTERDVILLVFLFLDTESLQDITDAEDKLMCLHSTASKIINNISTMPMAQNILRMCADDSDQQGTCYWLCKTEQAGGAMVFSDNGNC